MKESILSVDIFRHGKAFYKQGKEVAFLEANDLTLKGAIKVVSNAKKIAEKYEPGIKASVFTSPYARALQTAKLIAQVLNKRDINVDVTIVNELEEVRGITWPILKQLMNGGKIKFQGKKFNIDKNFSNPLNLSYPDFFIENCINLINIVTLSHWPKEFVSIIEDAENYRSTSKRMMTFLRRLANHYISFGQKRAIIVTHNPLLMDLIFKASKGEQKCLDAGGFINVDVYSKKIVTNFNGYRISIPSQ